MRRLKTGLVVFVLLLMTGTLANGQMILNGDFEIPDIAGEWEIFSSILGWEVAFGQIEIQRGGGTHIGQALSPGDQFVELDVYTNSAMFQDVQTEFGKRYTLSFYYSPRNAVEGIPVPAISNVIDVYWEDDLLASITEDGSPLPINLWSQHTFDVLATSDTGLSRLQFNAGGISDSYGGLLDKVTLEEQVIPEPSSLVGLLSMAGAGLLCFGWKRRKRNV